MDNSTFERLLFEGEGPTLDYKRDQYPFSKASEEAKSELLKDIIGFANGHRRSDAYILIGVREIRGERSEVIGIGDAPHLDDHSLQQFVNSLTNRTLRFHYIAFRFEDKQVGIIQIDLQQTRPIYLKQAYGNLQKDKVYIRRGTSTDPSKPASPDEIALMGAATAPLTELQLVFCSIETDNSLGAEISWDAELLEIPLAQIPDFKLNRESILAPIEWPNPNYFREIATDTKIRRLFRPVRVALKNIGTKMASDVRCEIPIPRDLRVAVITNLPAVPKQLKSGMPDIGPIRSIFDDRAGNVSIKESGERYRIEIDWGDLQPGRSISSEVFYLAVLDTGKVEFCAVIYAADLPAPKECVLSISANITKTFWGLDEISRLCSERPHP